MLFLERVVALTLLAVYPVLAQAPLGAAALGGTVRDPENLVVAGAEVILTEKSKGLDRHSTSDDSGSFLFPSIEPGTYMLRVTKAGFSTCQIEDLSIAVGQRVALDVAMQIGDLRSVVTVLSQDQARLETESNVVGTVVDSGRVRDLPLNGRDFLQLGLLAGGAVGASPSNNNVSVNVGHPDRMIVLPGTLPYSVGYFLNGIPIRGSRDGELALNLSIAAIDQFKIQEGFLMPDQWANAAAVNVVSKSGTNEFHGEAFEFLRNGTMDARSFFAARSEDLKQNQFGFGLGGPLWKNRLWFHGFYEGLRQISGFSSSGYSPTASMFAGDFAGTGHIIYDPATYDLTSGTRRPFANNVIPVSQINLVAGNLLKYYSPGSSLSSIPSNIYGNPRDTLNDDQEGLRLDAEVSQRQQLFAQIYRQNSPAANPGLFPSSGVLFDNQSGLVMLAHTWTINARMVNSLRVAFLRSIAIGGNAARNQGPLLDSIGIQNAADNRGVTEIDLQGYSSFGTSSGDVGNRDNTWHIAEGFNYSRSTHSFKFGGDLSYRRGWHQNATGVALGQLQFAPAFTAQLAPNEQGQMVPQANTGDSFADFLLGIPIYGQVGGLPVVEYRGTQFSPFIQDTWRIRPSVTLNYGFSWYLDTPPDPQGSVKKIVHGFDQITGLITYAALGQLDPKAVSTARSNFAPRFGLAWQPGFLKATVIRAAAGLYYTQYPWIISQFPIIVSPPFGGGTAFANPQTNPLPAYVLGANVFPPQVTASLTANYAASLPEGTLASALDPHVRPGSVSQWNVSIQRGLGKSKSIELAYLGSSGHHFPYYTDLSQCGPSADLFCSAAAKPWPRYDLILWFDTSASSSNEGLIAKYDHRMAGGLNLHFAYTFAKVLTDGWQSSQTSANQIASCRSCDKGPATFDVRHRAVASAVWDIPFGRSRRSGSSISQATDLVAGGWTLTTIATFTTGQPIYLTAPNQTGALLTTELPNRVCDGRSGHFFDNIRNNGLLWFDTACFPVPAVGYFGNSGRTVLPGPGLNNWDIGVQKNFPLAGETKRLQFRAEAFNAFNHAQFESPNGDAGAGANFGRISATRPPRLIQFALKVLW
jgi:hypothetical protein